MDVWNANIDLKAESERRVCECKKDAVMTLIRLFLYMVVSAATAFPLSACSSPSGVESKERNAIAQLLASFRGAQVLAKQALNPTQGAIDEAVSGQQIYDAFAPTPSIKAFLGNDGSVVLAETDVKVSVLFFQSKGLEAGRWECMVLSPHLSSGACVDGEK